MANVYGNPYEPDFAKQRPRFQPPQKVFKTMIYDQIQTVQGFDGARDFATNCLGPGASYIIADGDPNIARIYVISKDQASAISVSAFKLIPEEEPKQPTLQDISNLLENISGRLSKLEEKANDDKPVYFTPGATTVPAVVNEPKVTTADGTKSSKIPGSNGSN